MTANRYAYGAKWGIMQLGKWQRIGLVLSFIWVIATAIAQHKEDTDRAQAFADRSYKTCIESHALGLHLDTNCDEEKQKGYETFMVGDRGDIAIKALGPIPFAWILAYVLIVTGRAQVIGFRAALPWSAMPKPRKAFAVIAILITIGELLFVAMWALNFYTNSLVPVTPGKPIMVMDIRDGVVYVDGTWTREGDQGNGSTMGFPLQTSKIQCLRDQGVCREARASVGFGNTLDTDLVEYDIESWSDTTIVFTNITPCAEETFTIDRKTMAVNGIGSRVVRSDFEKFCALSPSKEKKWAYHMVNGYDVYWKLHQDARPTLLKVIQTFFGH